MISYVLDTGALVALERDARRLRAFLQAADTQNATLRTSAPTLAEFLGNAPAERRRQAEHVASYLEVDPSDEAMARRGAVLMREAMDKAPDSRPSAVDALGLVDAEALEGLLVYDGDRSDFEALAQASGSARIVALAELV